jgi:NAD(P)-dependent dehydrogenase (short-subunit alcohol dehydrogenase family)
LNTKTFVSIGSGPGIGTATAERFAREGFRIVLTSRNPASLVDRAKRLVAQGCQVEARRVDAGNLASVSALVRDVEPSSVQSTCCTSIPRRCEPRR